MPAHREGEQRERRVGVDARASAAAAAAAAAGSDGEGGEVERLVELRLQLLCSSAVAASPADVLARCLACCSRALASPVRAIVGFPDFKFTTPKSRQKTPRRNPVPRAFEQASLAANRFA